MAPVAHKTKRQHFVPKLLLRKFSADKRSISLFALARGLRVDGASIKEQCYADHFYGNDGDIEFAFSRFEGEFSRVIEDLSPERLEGLSDGALFLCRAFVHLQRFRTLAAAEQFTAWNNSLFTKVFAKDPRIRDVDVDLNDFEVRVTEPQTEMLGMWSRTLPGVMDLEVRFLVADRKVGFVISDDPAVIYNQWAIHHPVFKRFTGITGLAAKGLQMFLPVSPRVCVALFDPSVYQYGSPKRRICTIGLRDARLLNTLQAIHAHHCVYFSSEALPDEELGGLRAARIRYGPWRTPATRELGAVDHGDGTTGSLIATSIPNIRLPEKFGFLKVTDTFDYNGYPRPALPPRSREVVEAIEAHSASIDAQIAKIRGATEVPSLEDTSPANDDDSTGTDSEGVDS